MTASTSRRGYPARVVGTGQDSAGLRARILTATRELLIEGRDPRAVSIARVCARAACTPPSLYHYFATKDVLLSEVCDAAMRDFMSGLQGRVSTITDPLEELSARGTAYLEWGLANPGEYRVLFDRPSWAVAGEQRPADPGNGLADLVDNVVRCRLAGKLSTEGDPFTQALALWAQVHGLTMLAISNPNIPAHVLHRALQASQSWQLGIPMPPGHLPQPRGDAEG